MDFADSPEHAAFRAELRHWLAANLRDAIKLDDAADQRVAARPRDPGTAHRLAKRDARGGLGRDFLAAGIWRAGRQLYPAGDL